MKLLGPLPVGPGILGSFLCWKNRFPGNVKEALINSQNRISYVFLSNASSSVSLNSSLFASTDSLH